jgi:HEPN domain-containing protein
MYCQGCGRELPTGNLTCPACGFSNHAPGTAAPPPASSVEDLVADLKRTAKELARDAAKLSQRVVDKAGEVARDPPKSAKRVSKKVAEELDKAAKEIDRIIRDL